MRASAILLVAALFVPAGRAAAQAGEPPEAARAAFERGRDAYGRELFTQAEDAFREAYSLVSPTDPRRSILLLNLAMAIERQGGRDADALEAWRAFRAQAGPGVEAEAIERADNRIRELEERIARRARGGDDGGGGGISPIGPIVLGGGGAVLLAGVITGALAIARDGDLATACPDGVCADTPENRAILSDVDTLALVTDVLLIAGGVVAATGLVLTLVLRDEPSAEVAVACGPSGCLAFAGGRF